MFPLAVVLSLTVVGSMSVTICMALRTLRVRRERQHLTRRPEFAPKAAIILPLRGNDPFLADGLESLLNQDYPDLHDPRCGRSSQ